MAQNELILRLIKDGKIVGFAQLKEDRFGFFPFETSQKVDGVFSIAKYPVGCDSFEPGIKVGDEWWFEGDRGDDGNGNIFELIYNNQYLNWIIRYDDGVEVVEDRKVNLPEALKKSKLIGNIHEG